MDPWGEESNGSSIKFSEKLPKIITFEDNFKPLVCDTLPDSKEYLAILENKLNKLKSDPNLLRQLAEKRESCMQQLLSDTTTYCTLNEDTLETPVENSTILRTFAPEKQALTQGELVELVKYDQLINEDKESDFKHSDEQISTPD